MTNKPIPETQENAEFLLEAMMFAVASSVYVPESVAVNPDCNISNWRVFRISGKSVDGGEPLVTNHFVGYNLDSRDGRVSSPIVSFDKKTMIGTTGSGRMYKLHGGIGYNADAEYVWKRWLRINNPDTVTDVSTEYSSQG